ncbi:cytochrome P450 [Isoptericola sp. NEAU-Y5]|uniref:Cytochrome P450 n=1 Tax=Isoptericola luteus TaxID=2879484 RepID=A0ABS7ZCN0_9MICO|nr:cytochrome P450 [Isoptericola sp. NEAU-Y5]MCA5892197.1 cytochrome P450 [Isoptericola sp. NEAU-Y5]
MTIDSHTEATEPVDLRAQLDARRATCPVDHDGLGTWTLLRHADVVAAATDPETFSSAAGSHRAIPNSLDGAEHAAYRAVVDRYLTDEAVAAQEEQCRAHAAAIVDALPRGRTISAITEIGTPFAVRTQATWLGWPAELEDALVAWMADNHAATRSGDRARTAAVAARFDDLVGSQVRARREAGADAPDDVTTRLMRETVYGRPLTDAEVVSILRNWTAGDLGSLAASLGIVIHRLANNPDRQDVTRERVARGEHAAIEAAIEEVLRIDDPFVANRRRTTRAVQVGGRTIPAGERVVLSWTSANRDPEVFGDPDAFRPEENAAANLVFGAGPHVCPGRALTLMELRVAVGELLARTERLLPADEPSVREAPPAGGWAQVPVVLA